MNLVQSERLLLRRFTEADVDHLFTLHNDPHLMKCLTGGEPIAREAIVRDYQARFADFGYWAATARSTGEFLGWFAFHPNPDSTPHEYELGYRLHCAVWGQGYASEGSRALIALGFSELGVSRVWAETWRRS